MERRKFLAGLAVLGICPLCARHSVAAEGAHWSYGGKAGPDHWGSLSAANALCSAGSQQSPLDIAGAIKAEVPPISVDWKKEGGRIVNNGHTIQINMPAGSKLSRGDRAYELLQFHFHHPSEHLVEGRRWAMETHFVHQSADRKGLGVLGVFLASGAANPAFARLAAAFPAAAGKEAALDGVDPKGLLPASLAYWSYEGSLTTPPCSETVDWMMAMQPVEVAGADIAKFAALYPMNARPVLADNRRFILSSQ
jgi:carbonic anhydrase